MKVRLRPALATHHRRAAGVLDHVFLHQTAIGQEEAIRRAHQPGGKLVKSGGRF